MKVEYGQIKKYKPKQGYGYVTRTFNNRILKGKKDVYFHIKTIKYNFPELAKQLDNGLNTNVHFWYVLDTNERGAEVIRIWFDVDNIPEQYRSGLISFLSRIWTCRKSLVSEREQIAINLAGDSRRKELNELKEHYGDSDGLFYFLWGIIREMERKVYKPRKRIKDAYDGLPDELIEELFWVEMEYQTNLLSHISGGDDVVIEYYNGEVLGYKRIKDYIAYIEKILRELAKLSASKFRKLNFEDRMEIAEDFIDRIFVRKSITRDDHFFGSFEEVWNSNMYNKTPTSALKKYRRRNSEAINMKSNSMFIYDSDLKVLINEKISN